MVSGPTGSHHCRRSRRCCASLRPLTFASLSRPGLFHGIFSRQGGVSPPPWDSLNVGRQVGDRQENIEINRERIKNELRIPRLVGMNQVHGNRIRVVVDRPEQDPDLDQCDGLITNVPGTGLMVQQADCQAILLHDPVRRAVGIVHAGWRGTVANIAAQCVAAMEREFGSQPVDLIAAVSPSLGPCCGEFIHFSTELPAALHRYQVKPLYFDFWAMSRDQLSAAGVPASQISVAGICTVCNQDYFSYRRDKETGRFASIIGLKE